MSPILKFDRRAALKSFVATAAIGLGAACAAAEGAAPALPIPNAEALATDAAFWDAVRNLYSVTKEVVNLENGYWGIMAEPVREEYLRRISMVNFDNTFYARRNADGDFTKVRDRVAKAIGVAPEEVALTRGATEALQLLITGYNKLRPGDAVLYADLDYDSMQYSMKWLKDRRGVDVVKIDIPEPATRQNIIDTYEAAFTANPKLKLLLLTHLSHRTGLVVPIAEIARMAKARGIDVIVDAAHSWGQMEFDVRALGVDFIGFNLHKWIGSPVGCGCLYIAKDRLADIDRDKADEDWPENDIRSRVHTGTVNFATVLTIPSAIDLHEKIGVRAKEARLRHLRNRWVNVARGFKGVEILAPDEPSLHAGITSFRLSGKTSKADNDAVVGELRDKHKVLTVRRAGVAKGQCIRVSPALYTTEDDVDRFAEALAIVSGTRAG